MGAATRWLAFAVAGVAGLGGASVAHAHSGGVAGPGCGCHGNSGATVSVSVSPSTFDPGQQVTVTVTVGGAGSVAGLYVADDDVGSFGTISGQGMAIVASGMTHTSPKSMSGGAANFSFHWTPPGSAGAVRFYVDGVAGNGNGHSSGDQVDNGVFDFVYGCSPQTYYRDSDGDGYGQTDNPLIHCAGANPEGYAAAANDCDDYDPEQYPGAIEYCNQADDDCDGTVDEDALPVDQYPDADGDGYYGLLEYESGEIFSGCVPTEGWAAASGDCRPEDPAIHPDAEEVCNGFDDNCDGDIDERVRPTCGEGWCRREALGCDPATCSPGEPRDEECNFFDDDCDGIVDNDATCPEGEVCQAGACRPLDGSGADESGGDGAMGDDGDGGGEPTGAGDGTAGTGDAGAGADGAGNGGAGCQCGAGSSSSPAWAGIFLFLLAFRRRVSR